MFNFILKSHCVVDFIANDTCIFGVRFFFQQWERLIFTTITLVNNNFKCSTTYAQYDIYSCSQLSLKNGRHT